MISYFKYIDAGIFTLQDGTPYSGLVTVVGDNTYTGGSFNSQSVLLSATDTFFAQVISNKIDIGPRYNQSVNISKTNIVQRDILTSNTLNEVFDTLNLNNLNIYANQVIYNPNTFNTLAKSQDQLTYTTCLTSNIDTFTGKLLPKVRVSANNTQFYSVRDTSEDSSTLFLTTAGGKYYYFNNGKQMSGTINSNLSSTIATGLQAPLFDNKFFKYNQYNNTIFHTTSDKCYVYNVSYGENGSYLSLSDSFNISLTGTLTDRYNSAYGSTYRSALVGKQDNLALELSYTNSQESIIKYSATDLGFDTLNRIAQRFEDDLLVVVGSIAGFNYIRTYDISQLLTSTEHIISTELKNVSLTDVFELAQFDSNILICRRYNSNGTINTVDFRALNSCEYPVIQFSSSSLLGVLRYNEIINELDVNIAQGGVTLLQKDAPSNNNVIYDIQFSVSDKLNALLVLSDSFTIVNNSPFLNISPINLSKKYGGVDLYDHSVGLTVNNITRNILSDTLSLYSNSSKVYRYNNGVVTGTSPAKTIESVNADNIYMYENEYINVGTLNRIVNELFSIQQKLAVNIDLQV
jgi:hypothetical protein